METSCDSSGQQEVLLSPLQFHEGLETDRCWSQAAPRPRRHLSLPVTVLEGPTSCPDPQQAVVSISTCEHLAHHITITTGDGYLMSASINIYLPC